MTDILINKEQFLTEHNRLSPLNLQATFELLTKFQQEQKPSLSDGSWSFKLRMPFISWLQALPQKKIKSLRKSRKSVYKTYPYTQN